MSSWKHQIDRRTPCWEGYRNFLDALPDEAFPRAGSLNALLPPGTSSRNGAAIRFVAAADLVCVNYERHIYETGQVATRENNWHDLFNALVWCRLPLLKSTMNSLHFQHLDQAREGRRGRLRDALTLFDESGVIVFGSNIQALKALARHDWNGAFSAHRESWGATLQVLVCGHAILEKFLEPYKSITAHALLVHSPASLTAGQLDDSLGASIARAGWLDSPASLSPLPLMGIPGWWTAGEQDLVFYRDNSVFRPAPDRRQPAPIHFLAET